ncbi:asparaginase [Inhella sp. 4Y17]|uniref:Asparaginase n=1 Tax=Inhella gelatinilytica TaxID=2795030 RepID=A0A931N9Z0_9BURK|nr:asparaginase [Inhella gelatinilytica]
MAVSPRRCGCGRRPGAERLSLGDGDRPIFRRMAVKALQALPLVASGAAESPQWKSSSR